MQEEAGVRSMFTGRQEAGQALANRLALRDDLENTVVLALPRGGVPIGREIARVLNAPLDVMVVRKLGLPSQPELAMGAVASGGVVVRNRDVILEAHVGDSLFDRVAAREFHEVQRREEAYRGDRPPVELHGRSVILADDGIATGSTMAAAIRAARSRGAARVIVAVPVAPREVRQRLAGDVDEMVCLATPEPFMAISVWYRSFPQLEDEDVRAILSQPTTVRREER
jgi:putative phosphoribosyl transferase